MGQVKYTFGQIYYDKIFFFIAGLAEKFVTMYYEYVISCLFEVILKGIEHSPFCPVTFDPINMSFNIEFG